MLTIVSPDQLDKFDEELHLVQVGFTPAERVDVHVGTGDGVPVESMLVCLGALYSTRLAKPRPSNRRKRVRTSILVA